MIDRLANHALQADDSLPRFAERDIVRHAEGRKSVMRLLAFFGILLLVGCNDKTVTTQSADGSSESSLSTTACGDSAFFTACVHTCGETTDREGAAAQCVGGVYQCQASLIPATDCDSGSWTVPRLPCGPWVDGYDCGLGCAVCDVSRGWTCGACPDAAAADGS
jgi:hypothetical protein